MPLDPLAHGAVESGVSGTSSECTDPRGIVADSRAFRASVRVGERLQARVVADPSGLEVAGRRIAADLPAGLQPGQIIRLRIETVEGNQITMRLERGSVNANVASPPSGVSVSDHAGRGPVAAPRAFVAPPQIAQAPPARFQMGSSDPAALVRALRLPPSVETLAAARLALSAPQRVSNALATFEATLPGIAEQRLDGLRALIAFVARIDPDAPVLAQRIAAYVDHVVIGPEAKIVAMLAARDAASRVSD